MDLLVEMLDGVVAREAGDARDLNAPPEPRLPLATSFNSQLSGQRTRKLMGSSDTLGLNTWNRVTLKFVAGAISPTE